MNNLTPQQRLSPRVWLPRFLAIAYMLFLAVLSLDSFESSGGFFGRILAFLMHLLPVFWVGAVLTLAWHFRLIGGLVFMVLGMIFTIYYHTNRHTDSFLMISMPLFITGMLFIFSHTEK